MLEVFSAAAGASIYGAMKGFLAARQASPRPKFAAHALIFAICAYDICSRAERRKHEWAITGRTNVWVNNSIDSNSPKYFISNIPLLIGAYSFSLTVIGTIRLLAS